MRILAIDTALGACSACLFDTEVDHPLAVQSIEMDRGHAEALLPLVDQVMTASGVGFSIVDRFASTVGPGSFTGLRVGIAAVRGFALACQKPAIGVSTLAALSAPHSTEKDAVPVVAALDAKHGNVYFHMVGAGGRTLVAPRIASVPEAVRAVAIGLVRLVGSGAPLLAGHWPPSEVPAPVVIGTRSIPDVTWVARLAAVADPEQAKPRPLYLRLPDAKPQDDQRLPRR